MKKVLACSLLGLSLVTVTACSDDDDDKNDTPTVVEQIPNQLAGDYKTGCLANTTLDLSAAIREISFTSVGNFEKKETYFTNSGCTETAALTYRVVGNAQSIGALPENNPLDVINFTVNEAFVTVGSEAFAGTLNALSFCGKTDWAAGAETQIEGLDCQGFTINKGQVIEDVYEDIDGKLYFGKKFALLLDGAGARPTEVDMEVEYLKQ